MLKRVLIANRGEIALRVIRACRELDIETVAIYSTADESALHAQIATRSLCVGPARAADSYLNQDAILSAALATGCDAIHPGYGFLSENPDFADRCVEAGLKYIGPSGDVIRKMGSKAAARTLAQQAGVPVVPGSDGPLRDVEQAKELAVPTLIAAVEGTVIGAIPAAGGDIASIISWGNAKKMSKHPEEYGKGSLEGLAVASSANNAVIGGAMTTMMTLGIPGDAVTAILIGSLTMYGMQPGIKMFTENVTFTATIMILMLLANVVFLIFGLATAKISAKVLNVSQPTVWTAVCILCVVGSFALNNTFFDVGVMFAAGVLGFFLKVFKFPNGPFVLGLLLGSMLESNMRRALVMSHGSWATFVTRPVSCVLFIAIVLTFCWPVLKAAMAKKKAAAQAK